VERGKGTLVGTGWVVEEVYFLVGHKAKGKGEMCGGGSLISPDFQNNSGDHQKGGDREQKEGGPNLAQSPVAREKKKCQS